MAFGFTGWDSGKGILRGGTIYRASSSGDKVWGEENRSDKDLEYGVFVAVNPDGGIKPVESADDIIHGVVVRDIYGDKTPHSKTVNIGHFSHGDSVGVLTPEGETFNRGDRVYIIAGGKDAGKVTTKSDGNIGLGYWVERVSAGSHCVAVTLGYQQQAAALVSDMRESLELTSKVVGVI